MFGWLKSFFSSESAPSIDTALKHFRRGDFPKALQCANAIIESAPEVALSWRFKAECLSELGRFPDAAACYERAIELGGRGTEDLPNNLALVQFCAGNKAAAIDTLNAVIKSESSEPLKQQAQAMLSEFSSK